MSNENYYIVQGWMLNDLKLSGNHLIAYAIIYGFSQDGQSKFKGSLKTLSEWMAVSKSTVQRVLNDLCDLGHIEKHTKEVNGVFFNSYTAKRGYSQNEQGIVKMNRGYSQNEQGGIVNLTTNNNSYNYIDNNTSSGGENFFDLIFDEFSKQKPELSQTTLVDEVNLFLKKYNGRDVKNAESLVSAWISKVDWDKYEPIADVPPPVPNTIIHEMLAHWNKIVPDYRKIADNRHDLPAIRLIGQAIMKTPNFHLDPPKTLKKWQHFCRVVLANDFYAKKPLKTIANNVQTFITDMEKSEKGTFAPAAPKKNNEPAQYQPKTIVLDQKQGVLLNGGVPIRL